MRIKIPRAAANIAKAASKNSPTILFLVGLVGVGTTVVCAVADTCKAMENVEEEKERIAEEEELDSKDCVTLSKKEIVKVAWKPYIRTALVGTTSILCLIGSRRVTTQRTAMLLTAYKATETALCEYKNAVAESADDDTVKKIKTKVAENKLQTATPFNEENVIITGKGNDLCYDPWSDRYFRSSYNTLDKAINDVNHKMQFDFSGYSSLNEVYYEFGLKDTKAGELLGWHITDGLIRFDPDAIITQNGEPCIVIDFYNPPVVNFTQRY